MACSTLCRLALSFARAGWPPILQSDCHTACAYISIFCRLWSAKSLPRRCLWTVNGDLSGVVIGSVRHLLGESHDYAKVEFVGARGCSSRRRSGGSLSAADGLPVAAAGPA